MGRTYRRGGNYNHNSYGKSLREKRQRGGTKRTEYLDSYDSYSDNQNKKQTKDFFPIEGDSDYNY